MTRHVGWAHRWLSLVGLGVVAQLTTCELTRDQTGATAAQADTVQSFLADFFQAALAAYAL
jgi:hypothetical protein